MLTIFKPHIRKAIAQGAQNAKVGLLGGDESVRDIISDTRKKNVTIRSAVLSVPAKSKAKTGSKPKTGTSAADRKAGNRGIQASSKAINKPKKKLYANF